MELIESEILWGLKRDLPASLTLRLRRRAADMTEFIKCVIKELKLSVAELQSARSSMSAAANDAACAGLRRRWTSRVASP